MQLHKPSFARASAIVASLVLIGSASSYGQVTGSIWENDVSGNADIVPGGTPNMTFTSSAINYDSRVGGYSISGFMNSGAVTTFANVQGGSSPGDSADNTHVQLTGQIFLSAGANNFDIAHDDGLRINVGGLGTVLDDPNPTAPVLTPVTINNPGAAGDFTFTLDYNECCGAPSVLQWEYPTGNPVTGNVPDAGTTMGLFGISLTGLAAFARRFKK